MPTNVGDKDKNACCGCGVCEIVCPKDCISMECDAEGFTYPSVDNSKCITCGICLRKCPWERDEAGSPRKIYGLKSKSPITQSKASSGGAFQEIAGYYISKGHHVFGAAYADDFSKVKHIMADTRESLTLLRGSKYVQSDLCGIFPKIKELLNKGEGVIFSGTACQVAALRSYLGGDYPGLFTIDILCHGVPSPLLYKDFIHCIESRYGRISNINMKDKTNGWGHQKIIIQAVKHVPQEASNLWSSIFYSRVALRPSCYDCKYMSLNRVGDISLGDFWGIEKVSPEFYDPSGVSLAIINTPKGADCMDQIKDKFKSIEVTENQCLQPVLTGAAKQPEWRELFWNTYHEHGFCDISHRFWNVSLKNEWIIKCRRFIFKLFRIFSYA